MTDFCQLSGRSEKTVAAVVCGYSSIANDEIGHIFLLY
jgi:hypothetical protein